jgi:putative hydrolase of the HAD superfamily
MPIRAVLFDADGVVIFPWRFARHLAREREITPEMTHGFFHGVFEECLVGRADLKQVLPPFLRQWGWHGSVDDFVAIWLEMENAVDGRILALIRALRGSGLSCCLVTSQERYRAEYMRATMGFAELFDRLFFSCELGCQKPDHAYYQIVETELGLEGQEILFWDDSAVNVASARRWGWNAEVYTEFETFEKRLGEYVPKTALP